MMDKKIISFPNKNMNKIKSGKVSRSRALMWPENLIIELYPANANGERNYGKLTDDQMDGLIYVLDQLSERERVIIYYRYLEYMTIKQIAQIFKVSNTRVLQLITRSLNKMRHPVNIDYIRYGLQVCEKRNEKLKEEIQHAEDIEGKIKLLTKISIEKAGFTERTIAALKGSGKLSSMGDIVNMMGADPASLIKIRGIGKRSVLEVIWKLEGFGIDCSKARQIYNFESGAIMNIVSFQGRYKI